MNEIHKNLSENEIVCSNWDFVKVGDDWTLDGISMNLNNKAAGRFGNFRWKYRLRMSVLSGMPFMNFIITFILQNLCFISQFHFLNHFR